MTIVDPTDTTSTYPELNTDTIFDLIRWADQDDRFGTELWGIWDQSAWGWAIPESERQRVRNGSCQTAYCMAGQTVHQAGYRLNYGTDTARRTVDYPGLQYIGTVDLAYTCVQQRPTGLHDAKGHAVWEDVPGAHRLDIAEVARDLLGLTPGEAEMFFEGDNDLVRLRRMANLFCQKRALPPLFPHDPVYDVADFPGDEYIEDYPDDDDLTY